MSGHSLSLLGYYRNQLLPDIPSTSCVVLAGPQKKRPKKIWAVSARDLSYRSASYKGTIHTETIYIYQVDGFAADSVLLVSLGIDLIVVLLLAKCMLECSGIDVESQLGKPSTCETWPFQHTPHQSARTLGQREESSRLPPLSEVLGRSRDRRRLLLKSFPQTALFDPCCFILKTKENNEMSE